MTLIHNQYSLLITSTHESIISYNCLFDSCYLVTHFDLINAILWIWHLVFKYYTFSLQSMPTNLIQIQTMHYLESDTVVWLFIPSGWFFFLKALFYKYCSMKPQWRQCTGWKRLVTHVWWQGAGIKLSK
jgi:hypothetical protein